MQPFHESDTGRCIWAYLNPVVTPTCRGSVFVLACRHGTGGTRCKEFKSWTLDIVFGPSLLFVTWTRPLPGRDRFRFRVCVALSLNAIHDLNTVVMVDCSRPANWRFACSLAFVCKLRIDHFTPQVTNGDVGLLHSRGSLRRNYDCEITVRRQWFAGTAC